MNWKHRMWLDIFSSQVAAESKLGYHPSGRIYKGKENKPEDKTLDKTNI